MGNDIGHGCANQPHKHCTLQTQLVVVPTKNGTWRTFTLCFFFLGGHLSGFQHSPVLMPCPIGVHQQADTICREVRQNIGDVGKHEALVSATHDTQCRTCHHQYDTMVIRRTRTHLVVDQRFVEGERNWCPVTRPATDLEKPIFSKSEPHGQPLSAKPCC